MTETRLITVGFVVTNLVIKLKTDFPTYKVIAFDNLKRRIKR